ncbi:hypothetical protein MLD38_017056 [Melastoma candidum]|uniref:Uncharacterized protein n=1 Tax=Melastoma candidum TaxID=119954 RepID=A0ACB9QPE3_9MYRT|nr:hypothetical protein MLD38_017056 [Melastoma candidum]
MGRRKVVMKRIENNSSRQVTFSKRRGGLIKKARELSILCDVQVALLVFSSRGKLYEFCSGDDSLADIIERYRNQSEEAGTSANPQGVSLSDNVALQSTTELLQLVDRYVEGSGEDDSVNVNDFMQLEERIDAALVQVRRRKTELMMDSVMTLQQQERLLREENELLEEEMATINAEDHPDPGETRRPTTLNLLR